MALIKERTTKTGVSAEYWSIKEANFTLRNPPNSLIIIVDGYVDKEKRNEGYMPIETLEVFVENAGNVLGQAATPNMISGFYTILKSQEGWEDAQSDEEGMEALMPPEGADTIE